MILNEQFRRMQQLAGIPIKEQFINENIDTNKLQQYHDFLLDLGGADLAGEFEDMLDRANEFASIEGFIEDEINVFIHEDEVLANKISQWAKDNL